MTSGGTSILTVPALVKPFCWKTYVTGQVPMLSAAAHESNPHVDTGLILMTAKC